MYGGRTALFCPSNVYHNAEWPSDMPAGTYVEGDYCRPGWSGVIGRECQANGQWSLTTTGECTRMIRSVRETCPCITHRTLTGATSSSLHGSVSLTEIFCPPTSSGDIDGFATWPNTPASDEPVEVAVTSCDETYEGSPWRMCNSDGTWGPVQNPCTRTCRTVGGLRST